MNWELLVLVGIFVALVFVGIVMMVLGDRAVRILGRRKQMRMPFEGLPTDYLTEHHRLIRPLRQARSQIQDLVNRHEASPQAKALGRDMVAEADQVIHQCMELVGQIDGLRKVALQKPSALRALDGLRKRQSMARTDAEREGCAAAMKARESEMAHYDAASRHADALEAVVLQAHAAVAELHARFFRSLEVSQNYEEQTEGLREGLGRLRSLRESVSEADDLGDDRLLLRD